LPMLSIRSPLSHSSTSSNSHAHFRFDAGSMTGVSLVDSVDIVNITTTSTKHRLLWFVPKQMTISYSAKWYDGGGNEAIAQDLSINTAIEDASRCTANVEGDACLTSTNGLCCLRHGDRRGPDAQCCSSQGGTSLSAAQRRRKRLHETESTEDVPRSGKPCATTAFGAGAIERASELDHHLTV
jgi:hypothetical protein